jgi:hypothetical protein
MAVASDGSVIVNAHQLAVADDLAVAVEAAQRTGLVVFVGVVVPDSEAKKLAKPIDDAAAEVAARVGAKLTAGRGSASCRSSAAARSGCRDRDERRPAHPQGRRRGP